MHDTIISLPPHQPSGKFERERAAFLRLLPSLLATHRGRFVAIHEEQVIDADEDDLALIARVLPGVGNVDIYVGQVTETPDLIRLPHYREVPR